MIEISTTVRPLFVTAGWYPNRAVRGRCVGRAILTGVSTPSSPQLKSEERVRRFWMKPWPRPIGDFDVVFAGGGASITVQQQEKNR